MEMNRRRESDDKSQHVAVKRRVKDTLSEHDVILHNKIKATGGRFASSAAGLR